MRLLSLENRTPLQRLLMLSAMSAGGSVVEDTATGNPLTFETDLARPLKSLVANFLPIQASGTPSPDNILPITGWDAVNVFHAGKNLFNKDDPNIQLDKRIATGGTIIGSQYSQAVTGFIPVKAGTKYMINSYVNQNYFSCFYSEKDITKPVGEIFGNNEFPKVAPSGAEYLIVTIGNAGIDSFQIEIGSSATTYEPYNGTVYPVSFPSTIYGGYVDMVTGEVWATWKRKALSELEWKPFPGRTVFYGEQVNDMKAGNQKSLLKCDTFEVQTGVSSGSSAEEYPNYSIAQHTAYNPPMLWIKDTDCANVDELLVAIENAYIVYQLAFPVLITTLTPQQINAIKGNNTVWSDANDDCSVIYYKKG